MFKQKRQVKSVSVMLRENNVKTKDISVLKTKNKAFLFSPKTK